MLVWVMCSALSVRTTGTAHFRPRCVATFLHFGFPMDPCPGKSQRRDSQETILTVTYSKCNRPGLTTGPPVLLVKIFP